MTFAPKPLAVTLALLSLPALGQQVFQPATIDHVTKTARDGQHVFVRGKVTGFPDSDVLTLKDDTGTINVDVEHKHLQAGLPIGAFALIIASVEKDDGVELEADWVRVTRQPGGSNGALKRRTISHVFNNFKNGEIVVIRGKVERFPDDEEMVLKDDSGSITVDLDQDPKQRDGIKLGQDLLVLCKADKEGLFEPVKELDALVIDRNPGASPVARGPRTRAHEGRGAAAAPTRTIRPWRSPRPPPSAGSRRPPDRRCA